jgi:hypothetical protein
MTYKIFTKQDSLEALYYVWGKKPIEHLFQDEIPVFKEDLALSGVRESEYLEYARKHS